jgi:phosphatidylinositol glycan class N
LNHLDRKDVEQADIAPLMAALIGVNYPANNVGLLPLSYLDVSPEFAARSIRTNALQVLEQYRVKEDIKRRTELAFRPYQPMEHHLVENWLAKIDQSIATGDYAQAETLAVNLIKESLRGLRYYQT